MPQPILADERDPRIQAALSELRALVLEHYPGATFSTYAGEDPEGIRLAVTVDVEELDEVADTYTPRLVQMQVEEALPVYVVLEWPAERIAAYLQERKTTWSAPPILELIS
jgi:hypothetical protein